jgi:hypothetical protein
MELRKRIAAAATIVAGAVALLAGPLAGVAHAGWGPGGDFSIDSRTYIGTIIAGNLIPGRGYYLQIVDEKNGAIADEGWEVASQYGIAVFTGHVNLWGYDHSCQIRYGAWAWSPGHSMGMVGTVEYVPSQCPIDGGTAGRTASN